MTLEEILKHPKNKEALANIIKDTAKAFLEATAKHTDNMELGDYSHFKAITGFMCAQLSEKLG